MSATARAQLDDGTVLSVRLEHRAGCAGQHVDASDHGTDAVRVWCGLCEAAAVLAVDPSTSGHPAGDH